MSSNENRTQVSAAAGEQLRGTGFRPSGRATWVRRINDVDQRIRLRWIRSRPGRSTEFSGWLIIACKRMGEVLDGAPHPFDSRGSGREWRPVLAANLGRFVEPHRYAEWSDCDLSGVESLGAALEGAVDASNDVTTIDSLHAVLSEGRGPWEMQFREAWMAAYRCDRGDYEQARAVVQKRVEELAVTSSADRLSARERGWYESLLVWLSAKYSL